MLQRISFCLLICLMGFCLLSPRAESTIYKVIIYNEGEETAQAMGIWVAENGLLTSESILHWGNQFFIENPITGARYLAEIQHHRNPWFSCLPRDCSPPMLLYFLMNLLNPIPIHTSFH